MRALSDPQRGGRVAVVLRQHPESWETEISDPTIIIATDTGEVWLDRKEADRAHRMLTRVLDDLYKARKWL